MKTARHLICLFIFLFFPSTGIWAQSEVQVRSMLGPFIPKIKTSSTIDKKVRSFSDYYKLDLNGDGHYEGISVENSDEGSSIHFFKNHYEHFQELVIGAGGAFSKVEKIELRQVSSKESVLLIFFSEGLQQYLSTRSRQRLFVIYLPPSLFEKQFKLDRGPLVFEEYSNKGHYHVRKYEVDTVDLNGDGMKEILLKSRDIERVMKFDVKNRRYKIL